MITDYIPSEEEKPLESDVVAWKLAWKLAEAAKSENPEVSHGDIVNIYVVDDSGNPINYHVTDQREIFNAIDIEKE